MKRALLLSMIALLLSGFSGPVGARDETPVIVQHDAEVLFPVAVRLGLKLNVGIKDVESASVRVYQPGGIDTTDPIAIPDDMSYLTEDAALVKYLWTISPAEPPALFSTVFYQWELKTTDGQVWRAEGDFFFEDTRRPDPEPATWQHSGDESPVQLYSHNSVLALNLVQMSTMRAYEKIRQDTGFERQYRIVIYDPDAEFCLRSASSDPELYIESRTIGGTRRRCDPALAERIYRAQGFTVVRRANLLLGQLQNQLIDLIVGDAYDSLWQRGGTPPVWFRDGLLQYHRLAPQAGALTQVRSAERVNSLPPLALPPDADAQVTRLWHMRNYLLVLYMAAEAGAPAPVELARRLGQGQPFDTALRAVLGVDEARLMSGWRTWLFREAAEAAVRWTPYQANTPTPTPTRTTTPTLTPTIDAPTPTRTTTPTFTPLPIKSNTPVPPTPTNTALPPGSLRRPTPIPTEPPTPAGAGPCPGGLALLAVPLGWFALAVKRRRS